VLFDFDGTLGDSYPSITASVNHVRAAHQLPPLTVAEVLPHVGRGPAYLMEKTVGGRDTEADVAAYKAHQPSVIRAGTRLLPGAEGSLRALKRAGVLVGVCSNKPVAFTHDLLGWFGVAACFDVVLGPEDVARPKPAPDMLRAALELLKVDAADALYVGDMVVDIETARAAGVRVWSVATGSDRAEVLAGARPDRLLHSLTELPGLLHLAPPSPSVAAEHGPANHGRQSEPGA
jgi:phosphoglycolate phosphatase